MNTSPEPTTIGLSKEGHRKLQRLKEEGFFAEMMDAYRFAVAMALSQNKIMPPLKNRKTIFNIGTLDPEKKIYEVVQALTNEQDEAVYHIVERLAEWGVFELYNLAENGEIPFGEIITEGNIIRD